MPREYVKIPLDMLVCLLNMYQQPSPVCVCKSANSDKVFYISSIQSSPVYEDLLYDVDRGTAYTITPGWKMLIEEIVANPVGELRMTFLKDHPEFLCKMGQVKIFNAMTGQQHITDPDAWWDQIEAGEAQIAG